jgi:drug/metabolite transporter (DMT)-like permease
MHLRRFNRSTWAGLMAIILWSGTIALTRSLSERLGPLTAGACVYLAGSLLLVPRVLFRKQDGRSRPNSAGAALACGALFVLYTVLLYLAIGQAPSREQALEVGVVNYVWPAFTLLLSVPLQHKRAGLWLAPGTLLALTGVLLVFNQGDRLSWSSISEHVRSKPAPYLLALVAAVSWALYSNLTRKWAESATASTVALSVASTAGILFLARCVAPERTVWSAGALAEAALLGGITAWAYELWDRAMRRGNLVVVAVCSYFTPVLSTLVSCVYLRVAVSSRFWLGCLLLVAGSLLSWKSIDSAPQSSKTRSI